MIKFIMGIVIGIVVSTVGVSGIVKALDQSVDRVKSTAQETLNK